jgi:hypothetical protein
MVPLGHTASQEKPRTVYPELSPDLGGHRTRWSWPSACQSIWPAIDKKRKLINNLRRNMPMFVQIVPNMQLSSRWNKAID